MSLPIPLTVRLRSPVSNRSITREIRDLRFRWQVPGGFGACTVDLARPIAVQPTELAYYSDLTVYDGRNGSVVYTGRVEDLGRSAGRDGQVWQVATVGPSAHAKDRVSPLIYVDRDLSRWIPRNSGTGHPKAERRADVDSADNPVLRFQAPTGTSWAQNQIGVMAYPYFRWSGLKLGAFNASGAAGANTTNWRWQQVTRSPAGVGTVTRDVAFTAPSIAPSQRVASLSYPAGDDWLEFRMLQSNATAQTPSDLTWATFNNVYVMQLLVDQNGVERYEPTFDYADGTILASDVVRDLLGRMLPLYDGATATITTTAYGIDQLAYVDGVTAARVLDDLMALHWDTYWAAWEKTPSGKYRFEYTTWSSSVRYEASIGDGIDMPQSVAEVWNGLLVRGRQTDGTVRTARRTTNTPILTAAGLTRETTLDLGDEVWSTANISQAGDQFFAAHQYPTNSGTLNVSRPILDRQTGRMVQPWEIRPGLIRVRGVSPAGPDYNNPAGGRNGYTIFRIVGSEYSAADNTNRLELDSRPRTTAQMLAESASQPQTRRR